MSSRVKLAIVVLLGAGIIVLVAATLVGGDSRSDISVTVNDAVDQLIPARGAEVLQQQEVGVDLGASHELISLVIFPNSQFTGGVEVISEVNHVDGLNQFLFAPGEGRLIEALAPDTNCAVARYVLIARRDQADSIDWCFEGV